MYTPKHFAVDDDQAAAFLSRIQAADLVTMTEDGLVATYLPLVFDRDAHEHGALLGHVARKNDQWSRPTVGDALVIAHGEDAYITPGWYPTKAEHGRVVPTWNYTTAHVYGELVIHDSVEWVDALVRRLTARQEDGRERAWSVDEAPADFHAGQLRAIVGIELVIGRVEAKFKMSQNQRADNIDGVIAGLTGEGREDVADVVRSVRPARA
ncbi:MAG TPA: FMN-binding negative transcriptional regulator [Gaiellaceae bacterium]|nr:FMN-binding negative transcriptional regulator [Gaiellaceae bacterium]